jgi:hypothetical protein
MELIAKSSNRVEKQGSAELNASFNADIEERLRYYAERIDQIEARLKELDHEWDIERAIQANASTLALVGLGLGIVDRRFNVLPIVVAGFLLQHALQGWCPPVPILRRLGFRTTREINMERYGLKALRGDLADLAHDAPGSGYIKARRALQILK